MAKTYVEIECEVKDAFDKNLKPALLKALGGAVVPAINAHSKLTTTTKSKVSFTLSVKVLSLTTDDKNNPKSLAATVFIEVIFHGDPLQSFKATGNGKMTGTNAKRLEADARDLVDSVVSDLLKNKVIPQMAKWAP